MGHNSQLLEVVPDVICMRGDVANRQLEADVERYFERMQQFGNGGILNEC